MAGKDTKANPHAGDSPKIMVGITHDGRPVGKGPFKPDTRYPEADIHVDIHVQLSNADVRIDPQIGTVEYFAPGEFDPKKLDDRHPSCVSNLKDLLKFMPDAGMIKVFMMSDEADAAAHTYFMKSFTHDQRVTVIQGCPGIASLSSGQRRG